MGFRKSSIVPTDQGNETICSGNGVTTNGDSGGRSIKPGEIISTHRLAKGNSLSTSYVPLKVADPSNTMWPEVDKSGYIAKEGHGPKPVFRKRKTNTLVSKSKRVRIENEMIELKVTWEQAQGLLRPPPNYVPSVVVIEGFEFEEYEDAPIIGRPTILATDHADQKIQWAQCEDCFKWRKVPDSALFPSRWTCSDNLWDPERSVCSVAQELTTAQLEDLLPKNNEATLNKLKATKEEPDSLEALEGLDTLANLAIQEEGDSAFTSSSQATTRHPRHRPGCTCIVCIQPPSGKGPKHKQTCTCNVCLTVKRRFRTLMLRREMKQSEKDAETAAARQKADDDILLLCNDTENTSPTHNKTKSSTSPFKGQIDLNIQPEREEELSPVSDSGGIMRLLAESSERYLKQQKLSSSSENRNSTGSPMPLDGAAGANFPNGSVSVDKARNQGVDLDYPVTSSSMDVIALSTAPER